MRMSQDEELDIPLSECCTRLSTDEQKHGCTCNNVLICLYKCGGVGASARFCCQFFLLNMCPQDVLSLQERFGSLR